MCRPEDELVELLWRDGQLFMQSQTQREQTQTEKQETLRSNNFLEDQETISWLQYPPDEDFSSSFFYTFDPSKRPASEKIKHEAGPDPRVMPPPKFRSTDSSSVMTIGPSHCLSNKSQNDLDMSLSHDQSKNMDESLYPNSTSSSGGSSGCSFGKNIKEMANRKRKHIIDTDESVSQSDAIGNKSNQRSGSTRRSRASEVHNLFERRRRDRINERMKALQEIIPHCNKTDKASILDEAIDYLKSLQLQLQVMWMRNGMASSAPVMLSGIQTPPFIPQMQCPVQLPRFPVMERSAFQNNPGFFCQNPAQNQAFSDRFARYMGGFPQMQASAQQMEMLRFSSPAGQQSQEPSAPMKTDDGPCMEY